VSLRCGSPPKHLSQLKTWAIYLIEAPSGISTLIFEKKLYGGGSLLISQEKYIKDGKVLDHLGILSQRYFRSL
jgi:hypothetical protein